MASHRLLLSTIVLIAASASHVPWRRTEIGHPKADDGINYRIPSNIIPIDYIITLKPNFDDFTFDGHVDLTVNVQEATDTLYLHIYELTINDLAITGPDDEEIEVASQQADDVRQFWITTFENQLEAGSQYVVSINFTGILNDEMDGFYRSSYVNANGDTVWLATTQFESVSARRAFPCFDEPALKATFSIVIIRPSNLKAISNMPLESTVPGPDNGLEIDTFMKTPRMSTYLVAFIISDFSSVAEDQTRAVYARPEATASGQSIYAFQVGNAALQVMADFTGIPYTMPKMDQAAIPDFAAGAMENWGLVTYREPYLLWTVETSTTALQQSVATVIAHEFSHQWFGDLVTPAWWSAIWLNEGFATYFEFFATALFEVDAENTWNLPNQFAIRNLQYAFVPDSLDTTRPMTVDISSPTEAESLFDTIAYEKAGSVIRMTEHFITTDAFKSGLNSYLTEFDHGNAQPEDLFRHWQLGHDNLSTPVLPEDLTVADILDGWTTQKGYPLIRVTVDQNNNLVYTQERFLSNDVGSDTTTTWIVPINVATSTNPDFTDTRPSFWLRTKTATDTSVDVTDVNWYILNKQQIGYYRVTYPEDNWAALASYLNNQVTFRNIHEVNRAQILDDAFKLALAGVLSYEIPLNISRYIQQETAYVPYYAFLNNIITFLRILPNSQHSEHIKQYIASLMDRAYLSSGIVPSPTDSHAGKLNRINIVRYACLVGHSECRIEALVRLRYVMSNMVQLDPDMTPVVYCAAMREGTEDEYNYLLNLYRNTPDVDTSTRNAIITALGCSSNRTLLNNFLLLSLQDSGDIKNGDHTASFISVYQGSDVGVQAALDFLTNRSVILFRTAYNSAGVQTILTGLGNYISTQAQLDQLTAYVNNLDNTDERAAGQRGVDAATTFVNFAKTREPEVTSWIIRELNLDVDGSAAYLTFSFLTVVFSVVIVLFVQ